MHVVYALEPLPTAVHSTIFLAGPTPRDKRTPSWRPEALRLLSASGYTGHVFVPEAADGEWTDNWAAQVAWEEAALHRADCIVFWVPRDMQTLPGLTTNIEKVELENVALAAYYGQAERPGRDEAFAQAKEALALVGLPADEATRCDGLGAAGLKKLELARALDGRGIARDDRLVGGVEVGRDRDARASRARRRSRASSSFICRFVSWRTDAVSVRLICTGTTSSR